MRKTAGPLLTHLMGVGGRAHFMSCVLRRVVPDRAWKRGHQTARAYSEIERRTGYFSAIEESVPNDRERRTVAHPS